MKNDSGIHVVAFMEQPTNQPISLQVHIINESPAPLAIWSDLDSINIPKDPPGNAIAPVTELTHVDFGAGEGGRFLEVAPGESVKVTLILRDTHFTKLERVKAMQIPVKFHAGNNDQADVKTLLVQGNVHKTLGKN